MSNENILLFKDTDDNGKSLGVPDQSGGCFIKGTRVHTREGLKPIEEIQVGDYVLASPEDGYGASEYRQVVNTFKHEKKRIFRITYSLPDRKDAFTGVTSTGNHPFWVEGLGWTRADQLKHGQVLRATDGSRRVVAAVESIYRTKQEGIGWISAKTTVDVEAWGSCFDYENYALFPDPEEKLLYIDAEILESENPFLEVTVYNFEVEGHHTYFVGSGGIWVRNTNCANLRLFKEANGVAT